MSAAAHTAAAPGPAVSLSLGGYSACIGDAADLREDALGLRARAFRSGGPDEDRFDSICLHGIVRNARGETQLALRTRLFPDAAGLGDSYTAQFYDLAPLARHAGPYLELGRVCQGPGPSDLMALRLVWAALGALVDAAGVRMLIGCSSFAGTDPAQHHEALATLRAHHLGPASLRPLRRDATAIDLPEGAPSHASLPHLLRSYLNMGGWVGDHAVPDPQLGTVHVFTGLCVADIPPRRARHLRALARAAQTPGTRPLDLAPDAP